MNSELLRKQFLLSVFLLVSLLMNIGALASQDEEAYTTGFRYNNMRQVTGEISPDSGGDESNFVAKRYTYNSKGLLETAESGYLSEWQTEDVQPQDWSGFHILKNTTITYNSRGLKVTERAASSGENAKKLTQYS